MLGVAGDDIPLHDDVDDPWIWLSATQINLYDECARKWAFKYVAKAPDEPQTDAQKLGVEIEDEQLQPYLRAGTPFDYTRPTRSGYKAASILQYLPPAGSAGPGSPIRLQQRVEIPGLHAEAGPYGYQGWIDLWVPDNRLLPIAHHDGVAVVSDFKSTKRKKYIKTAGKLATDTQGMLYATWALRVTRAPHVDLLWLSMLTQGAERGIATPLRVSADKVAAQFKRIDATGAQLVQLRRKQVDPLSLPPSSAACRAYGRDCPYIATCNLSPLENFEARAAQDTRARDPHNMSNTPAVANLFANLANKAASAPVPVAAPIQAPPMLQPQVIVQPMQPPAILVTQPPVSAPPAGMPVPPPPAIFVPPVATGPINPPEAALPPAPPVSATPAPTPAEPKAEGDAEPKRGPGRPRKTPGAEPVASGDKVVAVWGKESYWPSRDAGFEVGPFTAETTCAPGETPAQALERLMGMLGTFAETERNKKAASFAALRGT